MNRILLLLTCFVVVLQAPSANASNKKLNVLLITVDDMNYDSLGVTGCKTPNISPNIDKLASQGILFKKAHVTIAVCQPTRAVWMTGRYPYKNGARGFEVINKKTISMPELLKAAGYFNGLIGKVPHVVPTRHKAFDYIVKSQELKNGRDPQGYYQRVTEFLNKAKESGKPFFLMTNSHDPHRPFAGSQQEKGKGGKRKKNYPPVKNAYKPNEVEIPGFLPDLPQVRLEISEYYTSVRRADAIVGEILRALHDAGLEEETLVLFLSDHGMALPFAKTNCYYHSTRTPWIVRWPGNTKAGTTDDVHFVSGIDLMPTVLDAVQVDIPNDIDGRSFVPLLQGKKQANRDKLYTVFHKTAGRREFEMRASHDEQYLYIFNAWADGKTVFKNESQSGRTMKAMIKAAKSDAKIAERVKLFLYRLPQELYDYKNDPDCLHNLVNDPKHRKTLQRMQQQMLADMRRWEDPLRKTFQEKAEVK